MAGHSAWKNIKHRKAKQDAARGKVWSKCARAIIVAAKNGGGDPAMNLTLRYAIDDAKAVNMPRDTIEKAIKKGTGELGAESYEPVRYEGYGPGGVAILVDCLTDNQNRTAPEMRMIFDKSGGNLGKPGAVAFGFAARAIVTVAPEALDEERAMDLAVETGADDVALTEAGWEFTADAPQLHALREGVAAKRIEISSAEVVMVPANVVSVDGDAAERVVKLLETLEDHDDVQKVHSNADISDAVLARLGG